MVLRGLWIIRFMVELRAKVWRLVICRKKLVNLVIGWKALIILTSGCVLILVFLFSVVLLLLLCVIGFLIRPAVVDRLGVVGRLKGGDFNMRRRRSFRGRGRGRRSFGRRRGRRSFGRRSSRRRSVRPRRIGFRM